MPVISIDTEDGWPPISFELNEQDAERFDTLMAEWNAAAEKADRIPELENELARWKAGAMERDQILNRVAATMRQIQLLAKQYPAGG